ncbi:NUDIX hydrolase [Phenylobacterium sp.]|uniref:NUDIX hydrolase n=1 Tax=Phenylobacterium sp. TaxID=1871053 RepID=UPI002DF0708D|nr:NUDIX domain-containing protein [Phenylobacterium sp.]
MRRRLTARVLLFDPQDRLLLMKGRLPSDPDGPGAWFTVGGGAMPGESVLDAAAREIVEETGFRTFELGPVIWRREGPLPLATETVWMDEHYIVARCAGGDPVRHGWQADEHALIDDIRWWTHAELQATDERVFPPGLADLLHDIVAGRLPETPLAIAW